MKAGTLVKTTKARIGVPLGTVGLVVKVVDELIEAKFGGRVENWIKTVAIVRHLSNGTERRYLFRDLEAAND